MQRSGRARGRQGRQSASGRGDSRVREGESEAQHEVRRVASVGRGQEGPDAARGIGCGANETAGGDGGVGGRPACGDVLGGVAEDESKMRYAVGVGESIAVGAVGGVALARASGDDML